MNKLKPIVMVLAAMLMLSVGMASANNIQEDGIDDTTWTLQEELFDTEPPGDVTDVESESTTNSITWTWTNPDDEDFAGVLVTVNGGDEVEVLGDPGETSTYTATGLTPNTEYTINIRTFDNAPEIAQIELCSKDPSLNPLEGWGMCDADTAATFTYTTSGSVIIFAADANELIGDREYALIYYSDSDPANVAASTIPIRKLANANSDIAGVIHFEDSIYTEGNNIPDVLHGDVNPRGKIWIVPTIDLIGESGNKFPSWAHIDDYLFEEDSGNPVSDPFNLPEGSIGGITFTYTGEAP